MPKRNTQQRRHQILEAVNNEGEVSVDQLARLYHTSEVTVRKDLAALEEAGLLLRRYGGAVSLPKEIVDESPSIEPSQGKRAIAARAAELIRDHNRIIIDSGSSCTALLPHLSKVQGLVVMTNSLAVAASLRELENEPTLLMTGGTWDKRSESFQGLQAEQMLRHYNFDQLFIGADGIDPERGTTTYNEFTALSRCMAEVAREVIVLAESTKTERKIPNLELPWAEVSTFVTDSKLKQQQKYAIEQQGVRVMCAQLD
ncbi:DeoR/GlpR family DNA-binding transcription regulator [Agaribacterium haliotis]|uniref:DeoR/GlpR family DNA-binding transcription regulator n=1 Tax=Agaribacterium haliotis TaxID=2013869 RepID=UPI000BB570F4|nr:DeoR family transcriptional regulator [Agaribacterium haliotis]